MPLKYAPPEPPHPADPRPADTTFDVEPTGLGRYGLDLTVGNPVLFHGRLCLPYGISPAPESFWDGGEWLEGPAGLAVGDHGEVFSGCSIAYHRPAGRPKITGLFRIDDVLPRDVDRLRILFPPLAHTIGCEELLCLVELRISNAVPAIIGFRCR